MAEILAKAFQRFDLSNKEIEGIDLSVENMQIGIEECKLSLVEGIMGEKIVHFVRVRITRSMCRATRCICK